MYRILFGTLCCLFLAASALAQVRIAAGTSVSGQLQGKLDAGKSKVGDQVLLAATKDVIHNGRVIVQKGAVIHGIVTEVAKTTKHNETSRLGISFDSIDQNGSSQRISAVINSVLELDESDETPDGGDKPKHGGGVFGKMGRAIGGAATTAGKATGKAATTAGKATANAGKTVGTTMAGKGGDSPSHPVKGLVSTPLALGGSVLTLTGDNVHLEPGSIFNLSVTGRAN